MGEETVSSMYSRLFKLPRLSLILVLGTIFSAIMDALIVSAFSSLLTGIVSQLTLFGVLSIGLVFLLGSIFISSGLSNLVFLRRISEVMNFRRTLGVSLFSLIFTSCVFALGWILHYTLSLAFLAEFLILALTAGFVVRLLVDLVMLRGHLLLSLGDSLTQPLLESSLLLWLLGVSWFLQFFLRLLVPVFVFAALTILYVNVISSQLRRSTGVDGRAFFSSFLGEWGAGTGGELEEIIDRNSVRKDLKITTLSFRNSHGDPKAILVVPSIHPGPFKGIGSSNLPTYLMRKLEVNFNCPVICAHGPSTHGENLVRVSQSENIYRQVLKISKGCVSYDRSSRLVKVTDAGVAVACQMFGEFALLTGSSSSSSPIDDVSLEVGEGAEAIARKYARRASFIDSHSCIDPTSDYVWPGSKISRTLFSAAEKATQQASKLKQMSFKVGAAKIRSTGISKADGMGEEGASAIVMRVGDQRIAYVFFDSNNLVAKLRDLIVKELRKAGYDAVEVLTSDTHSTSALTPGKLGYNPLGYSTPAPKVAEIAASVVNLAEKNLEDVNACVSVEFLKGVKVAGEENMQNILKGTRDSIRVAKKLALPVFGMATLVSLIMILLL